jgi:hypothetical protein
MRCHDCQPQTETVPSRRNGCPRQNEHGDQGRIDHHPDDVRTPSPTLSLPVDRAHHMSSIARIGQIAGLGSQTQNPSIASSQPCDLFTTPITALINQTILQVLSQEPPGQHDCRNMPFQTYPRSSVSIFILALTVVKCERSQDEIIFSANMLRGGQSCRLHPFFVFRFRRCGTLRAARRMFTIPTARLTCSRSSAVRRSICRPLLDTQIESARRLCRADNVVIFLREGENYPPAANYGIRV